MSIRTFTSVEEFFAAEAEAQTEARSRILPFQEAIQPGDHFFYPSAELHPDVLIWGEVLPYDPEDLADGFVPQPEYRFCHCFSVACPEGELGSVHISVISATITRGLFEAARAAGWPSDETSFKILVASFSDARASN